MTPSRIVALAAVLLLSSCDGDWNGEPDDQAEALARLAPGKQSCAVNHGGCSPDALCKDLGRRQRTWCTCKTGFAGNGLRCVPAGSVVIGRCALRGGPCAPDATCTQLQPNRAACACKAGFDGNGLRCTDIDECATDSGGCDANAKCTNTPGSRTCACNAGYEGDGFTCKLIAPKGVVLTMTPDAADFGAVSAGTAGPFRSFTIVNVGDVASSEMKVSADGPDAKLFFEKDNSCRIKLGPAKSCSIRLIFLPPAGTAPGAKSATWTVGPPEGPLVSAQLNAQVAAE